MFVLGLSNFEKSTEIRSENFSLVKSCFKARALYLIRGKVFWLFYLPNFPTMGDFCRRKRQQGSDVSSTNKQTCSFGLHTAGKGPHCPSAPVAQFLLK